MSAPLPISNFAVCSWPLAEAAWMLLGVRVPARWKVGRARIKLKHIYRCGIQWPLRPYDTQATGCVRPAGRPIAGRGRPQLSPSQRRAGSLPWRGLRLSGLSASPPGCQRFLIIIFISHSSRDSLHESPPREALHESPSAHCLPLQRLQMSRRLPREEYTVGWVCALPVELAAALEMLDEDPGLPERYDNDENLYYLGSIAGHDVVIVCLPAGRIGNNPAAAVATQTKATFKGIRFGLMVGVGGGVPSAEADIRLGDVVVSQPDKTFGGVVQYDSGKTTQSGFGRTGSLDSPPQILLAAVASIRANEFRGRSKLSEHIAKLDRVPKFQRGKAGLDVLFKAAYDHEGGQTCGLCSPDKQEARQPRESGEEVVVHYGTIASGNQVIKDARTRDRVSSELGGVLCFEMEAAGLMNSFPCLVIRGVCDYADSHKNEKWQPCAAATAAAYAKEVLSVIPPVDVANACTAEETVQGACTPTHYRERSQLSLNEDQRQNLLESLGFDQIDARHMTIKAAHAKTCRWLLRKPEYLDWLDTTKLGEHHGFLWIKGKPGTGKSTLMKFALANARKTIKDRIVIAFFFNARGEEIEKSTIGTYRSLLLQLLERLPRLQNIFDSLNLSTRSISTGYQWSIQSLETLLEQALQSLGETSVVCFIDALDECEEQQIRDMIRLFKRLGELAQSSGIHFHVCFSSRHYPHITIQKGLELVLEGQEGHTQDITNYLESELEIGQGELRQQIRVELQQKASGIFMWVVLVVGILNKEYNSGRIHALQRRLQEIPSDLHDLFRDILTRDLHNKGELVLCIQWVLFAKQPLSPEQLYFAILSGVEPDAISKRDPNKITEDIIRRFMLNSSKGLTEITASKLPKVQFIHESVKDFLLKDGFGNIWPDFRRNLQGQSHERLKQCCLNYMRVDVFTTLKIPKILPKASTQQAAGFRKLAMESFPFLEYAVLNVLYHADVAAGYGMDQRNLIKSFPLDCWNKYNSIVEKHEVRRYTEGVSLLYVAAEHNMANLIRVDPSARSCFEVGNERYGTPLFASIACGSKEAIQVFKEVLGVNQSAISRDELSMQDYKDEDVQQSVRRDFKFSRRRDIFSHAAELGNKEVLALLLKSRDFEVDAKDLQGRTPLWWASKNGHEAVAKLLLDTETVDVDSWSKDGQRPLGIAANKGNMAVVRVLIDRGANINAQGGHYGNALQAALARGYEQTAKLLIDKGADGPILTLRADTMATHSRRL
ncbi:hypothetical protein AOQ84DRAFT_368715 [Glonium stellatum]|uniref:Nucleoside phosphorylase domain-containing protein n=1 Tax=Glonium stellatum TaxID=574774 RepID=A0A8E2EQJ7_9PEZI|nr:hypothetical protein AOQ84DRAFT_368715 [Glonium stellatum]